MITFRKPESEERYQLEKKEKSGCALCAEQAKKLGKRWVIMPNEYPYDKFAEAHEMIVLASHKTSPSLVDIFYLWAERKNISKMGYHMIMWNFPIRQSVPGHFHLHLIRLCT